MRISKATKTDVKASTCNSVTLSDGTVIKNADEAKKWLYYKKEQDCADYGQPMFSDEAKADLAKLKSCFGEVDTWGKVESCNSSTSTDKALKHIKAAIDILGTSGDKSDVTKDSIANLSVVMFDLKGNK